VLIPQWDADEHGKVIDPVPGRIPEEVFEQIRKIEWATWQILSERFHFPETLRYRLCESVAGALIECGAVIHD